MVWPTSFWHQCKSEEEKWFGLVGVWYHPNQALLPSLEKVARKLTLLINTKDWHYAFVLVSEDLQHIPLSDASHISVLVEGHLAEVPVSNSANWRSTNSFTWAVRWYTQRA